MRWSAVYFVFLSVAHAAPPVVSIEKIEKTPDFCQTDKAGEFYDNGNNFCAPTAVSNSFVWLAGHGFPRLVAEQDDVRDGQIELIKQLADKDRMDTVSNDGTGPSGVMAGVQKYIAAAGYQIERLECQGWRPLKSKFTSTGETVSLDWLREAISNPCGAAWINIGWYQHDKDLKTYHRKGGHWMTLVGYGVDAEGNPDADAFVAYDPASRSGAGVVPHYFHLKKLQDAELTGSDKGLPRSAEGYYQIVDGIVPKKTADAVIIDAVVTLVLQPAEVDL